MSSHWHESEELILLELKERIQSHEQELEFWPDPMFFERWTNQLMKKIELIATSTNSEISSAQQTPSLEHK